MGLRDTLRSLMHPEDTSEQDIGAIASEGADLEEFKPRTNGTYVSTGGDGVPSYLRFHLNGKVYFAAGPADAAQARPLLDRDNRDPIVGPYTPAGRFALEQRFERPIVFSVQAVDDDGFTTRVTSTRHATSGEFRYTFEPDPD